MLISMPWGPQRARGKGINEGLWGRFVFMPEALACVATTGITWHITRTLYYRSFAIGIGAGYHVARKARAAGIALIKILLKNITDTQKQLGQFGHTDKWPKTCNTIRK